jgi:hypothetical protein
MKENEMRSITMIVALFVVVTANAQPPVAKQARKATDQIIKNNRYAEKIALMAKVTEAINISIKGGQYFGFVEVSEISKKVRDSVIENLMALGYKIEIIEEVQKEPILGYNSAVPRYEITGYIHKDVTYLKISW